MPDEIYKPVRINSKTAIAKAKTRRGFSEAWDSLEEEYAALGALLNARKTAIHQRESQYLPWCILKI